jgi:hypothetical protein
MSDPKNKLNPSYGSSRSALIAAALGVSVALVGCDREVMPASSSIEVVAPSVEVLPRAQEDAVKAEVAAEDAPTTDEVTEAPSAPTPSAEEEAALVEDEPKAERRPKRTSKKAEQPRRKDEKIPPPTGAYGAPPGW